MWRERRKSLEKKMQYLFTLHTSEILLWTLRVPKACRVLSDESGGIYVILTKRSSNQSNVVTIPLYERVSNSIRGALSEIVSFGNIFAILRSPVCGRIDIFMRSAYISKNLTEKGILPHEGELVRLFRAMFDLITFLPHSVPARDGGEGSEGLQMEEEDPPPLCLETHPMPMFQISEQFWDPGSKEFTKFSKREPKESPNASVVYLPIKRPTSLALPLLKTLVGGVKEKPVQGRRVNCMLLLDDSAPLVDTRLLTPETLGALGVLVMNTEQYIQWATPPELLRNHAHWMGPLLVPADDSPYGVVERRSALFKSGVDFRFAPWPRDYHWKMFACGSSGLDFNVPDVKADWHCLLLNTSALDYASSNGLSNYAMETLRDCERRPFEVLYQEAWQYLDASCSRVTPPFTFSVHVHTQEMSIPAEKAMEKKLRPLPTDAYFASFGFIWDSTQKKWCEKAFHRSFLKGPGGVLNEEHIEACFEGFMKTSAEKLLEGSYACPVCDETANRLLQGCGHMYCITCLKSIQEVNTEVEDRCPECRREFEEDDILEIKAQKARRPRAGTLKKESQKDTMLARQKALRDHLPTQKGPMQIETDETLCIIVAMNVLIDKVREWAPGVHIASLETLGPRCSNPTLSPIFSKLLLLSPHIPGIYYLESLHEIMQSWTTPQFELHVLRLSNGAYCEDMETLSSVVKSYNIKL